MRDTCEWIAVVLGTIFAIVVCVYTMIYLDNGRQSRVDAWKTLTVEKVTYVASKSDDGDDIITIWYKYPGIEKRTKQVITIHEPIEHEWEGSVGFDINHGCFGVEREKE